MKVKVIAWLILFLAIECAILTFIVISQGSK